MSGFRVRRSRSRHGHGRSHQGDWRAEVCLFGSFTRRSPKSNPAAKLPVEEAMYESGLDFIVLQPTMFMRLSTITGAACLSG